MRPWNANSPSNFYTYCYSDAHGDSYSCGFSNNYSSADRYS